MPPDTRRAAWIGLGQVALVLLSVGLGFAIGEWRAERADAERARLAMDAAVREMATNRGRIRRALAHHDRLMDVLASDSTRGIQLQPAFITDNAWGMAQATGVATDLPFPVIEALVLVHETQATYRELVVMNIGLLYFGNVFTSERLPSNVPGFASSVSDLSQFERQLLERYAEAFTALDAVGFAVPDSLLTPSEL